MSDLIERLTEVAKALEEDFPHLTMGADVREAVGVLSHSPRWIPTSERMPDPEGPMVMAYFNSVEMCNPRYFANNAAPLRDDGYTHWMPLPAAPEAK